MAHVRSSAWESGAEAVVKGGCMASVVIISLFINLGFLSQFYLRASPVKVASIRVCQERPFWAPEAPIYADKESEQPPDRVITRFYFGFFG